jgi:putative SOS response-associated peptidase YedK
MASRKVREGETTNDLFAFLTTEPNAIVAPIHPKAMPVILSTSDEIETWMTAPSQAALKLQRTFHGDAFRIVARGQKEDGAPVGADDLPFHAASNDAWPETDA